MNKYNLHPEMVTVEACIELQNGSLRTEKIALFAKEAGTTINTVYNWLKSGDMFVQYLSEPCEAVAVYRMVKFIEQK